MAFIHHGSYCFSMQESLSADQKHEALKSLPSFGDVSTSCDITDNESLCTIDAWILSVLRYHFSWTILQFSSISGITPGTAFQKRVTFSCLVSMILIN